MWVYNDEAIARTIKMAWLLFDTSSWFFAQILYFMILATVILFFLKPFSNTAISLTGILFLDNKFAFFMIAKNGYNLRSRTM